MFSGKQSWMAFCFVLIAQILFPWGAHAESQSVVGRIGEFVQDNSQDIAVTATILLIILLAAFVFKVGPERIARKTYELLRLALNDQTGKSTIVAVFVIVALGVGFGLYNSEIFDKLKDSGYARGVITYLIAISTIGLVFILALQIMFVKGEAEEQIKGTRDILAVLTGILGTIVGFYFGQAQGQDQALRVAQLVASPVADGKESVAAFVEGGSSPYSYILSYEDANQPKTINGQTSSGIIVVDLAVAKPTDVELSILDAHNSAAKRRATAPPVPAAGPGPGTSGTSTTGASPKTQ